MKFTVPFTTPRQPVYFVKIVSDRWVKSEQTLAIKLDDLIVPDPFPAPTKLVEQELKLV